MLIHGDKLRWLFWLRWKMFTRSFTRKATFRIIGTVIAFLFFFGVFGVAAVGTFIAYRVLAAPANAELLFIVLTALFLVWIILPLLEISTNEGLDLSKLALFPITRAEKMTSLLFSTLLDIPTLGLFFVLAAVVAGWASSVPLALMAFLAMIVFYVQLVGIGQLVLALLQPLLQSRRFRDLSIILTVLLFSSVYLCQFAVRGLFSSNFGSLLTHAAFSPYLQWLPPGMAARVIQQAAVGNWGMSFIWLIAIVATSLLTLYLWQLIVERGLTAAETGGTVRSVRRPRTEPAYTPALTTPATEPGGFFGKLFPTQVTMLAGKELKYIWRDPQIKAMFLQSLLSIVFVAVITFVNTGSHRSASVAGPWIVMFAPAFVLFSLFSLSYNVLGIERQSLTTLFLFPINPRYILWSKNLVSFAIGLTEAVVIALIAAFLTHAWYFLLPGIVVGITGISIIVGIGNFTSVFLPQQMRFRRRGFNTSANMSTEAGCLRSFMSVISLYGTLFIMVPVGLGLALPYAFGALWIWTITIPASLLYGGLIYGVITTLVAPRILKKAPEILSAVVKE